MKSDTAHTRFDRDTNELIELHQINAFFQSEKPYLDNYEHLMALEMEVRMHLLIAVQNARETASRQTPSAGSGTEEKSSQTNGKSPTVRKDINNWPG
jgi:hypothetical protein